MLRLVNGGVKRFTVVPPVAAKKSPAEVKRIAPLLNALPFLNVADGVLEAVSGALKKDRFPERSPEARFPAASTPRLTMLFPAIVKFGVELAVTGRLY